MQSNPGMNNETIAKGTRFTAHHADDAVTFEIRRMQGRGAWRAVIVAHEDYAGLERVFTSEQIRAALRHEAMAQQASAAQSAWFDALETGARVHYHSGFGDYVRTTVVEVDGKEMLRPLALVGGWKLGTADFHIENIRNAAPRALRPRSPRRRRG